MAIIFVTTLDDPAVKVNGERSLRQAVAKAADGDTIEFAPNLEFQDAVLNSNLTIDKSITIDGGDGVSAGTRRLYDDRHQ